MSDRELHDSLRALNRPLGDQSRELMLGDWRFRLEGLDRPLAQCLDRRWGAFLGPVRPGEPDVTVHLHRSEVPNWLDLPRYGERYRIEARGDRERRVVVAYHFAVCRDPGLNAWRVVLSQAPREPEERLVDNAVRYLVARRAIEAGGFCLHAAGLLHEGRAWFFAGPSGSGKTTAVSLCSPMTSLGDDLGVMIPGDGGWVAPAMPFDNAERIDHEPPRGWHPVGRIWRLHHAPETRIESPGEAIGVASLMGCTAFPWTFPAHSDDLLDHVRHFVADGGFALLHFPVDADLRVELFAAGPRG